MINFIKCIPLYILLTSFTGLDLHPAIELNTFAIESEIAEFDNKTSTNTTLCGHIVANDTLRLSGSPYTISCDVIVDSAVTLVIEAGVEINLAYRDRDIIVYGTLIAEGTPQDSILFTSSYIFGGGSIAFMPGSSGNSLAYTKIDNLSNYNAFNTYDCGVWIDHAEVSVNNCKFTNNTKDVIADANSVNGFGNNNELYRIWFRGNSLETSSVWPSADPNGFEYVMNGDLTVKAGDSLFIEPGVSVNLNYRDIDLRVYGTLIAEGTAQDSILFSSSYLYGGGSVALLPGSSGNSLEYVHMNNLSNYTIYNAYDCALWIDSAQVSVNYCTFTNNIKDVRATAHSVDEFGENNSLSGIWFLNNSFTETARWPNVDPTGFRYTTEGDLTVNAGDSLTINPGVTIDLPYRDKDIHVNGTFIAEGTMQKPIKFTSSYNFGGGSIALLPGSVGNALKYVELDNLSNYTIYNTYKCALWIENAEVTVDYCTFTNNLKDVRATAHSVDEFGGNNSLTGIWFFSNSLTETSFWPNTDPSGFVYTPEGDITVAAGDSLTIMPGSTINLSYRDKDIHVNGTLIAEGTEQDSIYFYSSYSFGGGSIALLPGSQDNVIKYVSINNLHNYDIYNTYKGGISISAPCEVSNSHIYNCIRAIRIEDNATAQIRENYIHDNTTGISVIDHDNSSISLNTIANNSNYGIYTAGESVNACNNYWGHPSGPYNAGTNPTGQGNKISDQVIAPACLLTEPTYISIDPTITTTSCIGSSDGTISLSIVGGTGPYTLLWETGSVDTLVNGLAAGDYSVTVNDADTLSLVETFTVEDPPEVELTLSNTNTLCIGDSVTISTINANTATWSNGATTLQITVAPAVTTTYYVSGEHATNCPWTDTITVLVHPYQLPGPVTNMIPEENAGNVVSPVDFTWTPGIYNSNPYALYIWEDGTTKPTAPTVNNILQPAYTYQGALTIGVPYNWQVVSSSSCLQTEGPIQQFTLRELPDLEVSSVFTGVTNVASGDSITVTWDVSNVGGDFALIDWSENIYIQSTTGQNRTLVGQTSIVDDTLQVGASYSRSYTAGLPPILSIGDAGVFVVEVVPSSNVIEPLGATANNTAIEPTSWTIDRDLYIALSTNEITENGQGVYCIVSRSGAMNPALTVDLSFTDTSRFNFPQQVTIPNGQAGKSFYIYGRDNNDLSGDLTQIMTASATGFPTVKDTLLLIDDEVPALSITGLPTTLVEGDLLTFDVSTNFAQADSLYVSIISSKPNDVPLSTPVLILPNTTTTNVQLQLPDDNIAEPDETITITAGSAGLTSAVESFVLTNDSDLPVISFELSLDTISESGGQFATQGIMTRIGDTSTTLTINLFANQPAFVLLPASVTMAPGESEKTFYIGAVENNAVDGFTPVEITASVFISACNCTASATGAGSFTKTLTIADNDGPTLTLTANPLSIAEGTTGAGNLTITRNTPTTNALVVNLSSDDLTEINPPPTVTIPANQASINIVLSTEADALVDGNQEVTLEATAPGFSPGIVWVNVTDINKPDLEIAAVTLPNNQITALDQFEFRVYITNKGIANAPSSVFVRAFLSEDMILDAQDYFVGEYLTQAPIAIGDTLELWDLGVAPNFSGTYQLFLQVNPLQLTTEAIYVNNTSAPIPIEIMPNYFGSAMVDDSVFLQDSPITIYGSSFKDGGMVLPNTSLDVYIIVDEIRRQISVTTDTFGNYTTMFDPLPTEAGHYIVGASYPGLVTSNPQDEFDILGVKLNNGDPIVWELRLGDTLQGSIPIENLTSIPLTNVKLMPQSLPNGATILLDSIPLLAGNATENIDYQVFATEVTATLNHEEIDLVLSSDEGVAQPVEADYLCQSQEGYLRATIASINRTVSQQQSNFLEFIIYNDGLGETGEINITLPPLDFISLNTPSAIPSLQSGDSALVILEFIPTPTLPLNIPGIGTFLISGDNSNYILMPFTIEKVSDATGGLVVEVVDEYTYYTAAAPRVANAHVKISHFYTGEVYAEGYTDSLGLFQVDTLPEGNLRLVVQADQHEGYNQVFEILPGMVNNKTVFLSYQAVSFTWNVVPTTVEDVYEVDLVMEFETNVPAPVVEMTMPNEMPELSSNETFNFNIILVNHGFIAAQDVELFLPTDVEYEFITNYTTMALPALSSIQIPVVMRRIQGQAPIIDPNDPQSQINSFLKITTSQASNMAQQSINGGCGDIVVIAYNYECGGNDVGKGAGESFTYSGRSSGGCGGSGGFGGGGAGGPGGGIYPTGSSSLDCSAEPDPCLTNILTTAIGCSPNPYVAAFGCGLSLGGSDGGWGTLIAAIGCIPVVGCPFSIGYTIGFCLQNPPGSTNFQANYSLPPVIMQAGEDLDQAIQAYDAHERWLEEVVGPLATNENLEDFGNILTTWVDHDLQIAPLDVILIKDSLAGFDIPVTQIDSFIVRWNATQTAWSIGVLAPNATYPNIINQDSLVHWVNIIDDARSYAQDRGFQSIEVMIQEAEAAVIEYAFNPPLASGSNFAPNLVNQNQSNNNNAVCASVTISITQEVTMTREAFEGTLGINNGHPTSPMDSLYLNLEILDPNGVLSNDLFEIQVVGLNNVTSIDGDGMVDAASQGTATILFIPEPGAAPTVPISYSFGGTISYLDPFSGVMVTIPLNAAVLQVNPSPQLYLHYFMQRDIYGDDPLTNSIEPILPAELAVMVENNGYGAANGVMIESAQPEIIDNEKGLAISFNLIGSNLQGQPATLGLNNINFGDIDPLTSKIGQWYFTSTLLGHFINYETNLVHLSSYGNPDLSLITGVELHEMIQSISVYGGANDGVHDFLVNEIQDPEDAPDAIYLSQGNLIYDVFPAESGVFTGDLLALGNTDTLTVDPLALGWNYLKLDDPGNGNFEILSVTREDGQVIPLKNVWLTHVTIPDSKVPNYENKFHIVDDFPAFTPMSYVIVWSPKDPNPPAVASINGHPDVPTTFQVSELTVTFSEEIIPSTFTTDDLTLILQGGTNIIDSTVVITPVDSVTYTVDLSSLTTGNGYYLFTVQAAGIQDVTGTNGLVGEQVGWIQYLSVPSVQEFSLLPEGAINNTFDTVRLLFNMPLEVSTVTSDRFTVLSGGVSQTGNWTITPINPQNTLFELVGLGSFLSGDGDYELVVDLVNIQSATGEFGLATQSFPLTLDTGAPSLVNLLRYIGSGLDPQHYTGVNMNFSEDVQPFEGEEAISLWRDGVQLDLTDVPINRVDGDWYQAASFDTLTYPNGDYIFRVDLSLIADLAGNYGSGIQETTWTVNRIAGLDITNLSIAPNMGYSNTDNITGSKTFVLFFDIDEPATTITIYQDDNGTLTLLETLENQPFGTVDALLELSTGGQTAVEIHAFDANNNLVVANMPLFIDEAPLAGAWDFVPNQVLEKHPDFIDITFSDLLLDLANVNAQKQLLALTSLDSALVLTYENTVLDPDGLSLTFLADTTFRLSGFEMIDSLPGNYTVGVDLTMLKKYSSGIPGSATALTSWEIEGELNNVPFADAGLDSTVTQLMTYTLDASNSYDFDGDNIAFQWFAPPGIVLTNSNTATPSFSITNAYQDTELLFMVSVSDGKDFSTDIVSIYVSLARVVVNAKVLLEGPYDGNGLMTTYLQQQEYLPLEQPYADSPWNHLGLETVDSIPAGIVDWVFVTARTSLEKDSIVTFGVGFLADDGQIVSLDGGPFTLPMDNMGTDLYLAIYHRNHVGILSAAPIAPVNGVYDFDLRLGNTTVFGGANSIKDLGGGYFGLYSGDYDGNGQVQNTDFSNLLPDLGLNNYREGDLDLNGEVQNSEVQDKLIINLGRGASFEY